MSENTKNISLPSAPTFAEEARQSVIELDPKTLPGVTTVTLRLTNRETKSGKLIEKNMQRASKNSNAQYHVVLDIDGTTPPITVVSGSDTEYLETVKARCKKTVDFRKEYKQQEPPPDTAAILLRKTAQSCCNCDPEHRRKFLHKHLPVCRVMQKYKWRSDLPNDIVSGLTVGIMQIPQGMAYALLAEMPPVAGLYVAFFPVLIYFLFGSSKHISMGTIAVVSLLMGSVIARFYDPKYAALVMGTGNINSTVNGSDVLPGTYFADGELKVDLPDHVKFKIAATMCLLSGLVQVGMGVLKLGFVTTYMSDPMIGGFTTGAAVHVGTSQVKYIFGLNTPRSDGVFQIIKTYALIFKHIAETNVATLIMSLICIVILYLVKVQINQRFKSKLKIPVPIELLVVVGGTLVSYFFTFSETFKVKIVGEIPAGMPTPQIPSMDGISVYSADIFIIAVVGFSQSVSLAALMAKKHAYSYDANQELIAYGLGNVFGSFFSCYPFAASVSRSSVQESAGGRTQLASVVSASLVLVIIVSIGPLFQTLPNCVLASIILVALRSLFLQVTELPKIWRTSPYDFFIWVVTFLCTVILHVDYGIMLGILFSFFTVVIRSQRTHVSSLQKVPAVQVYENSSQYKETVDNLGIKVLGFTSPLYYANAELFVKQVYQQSGVNPEKIRKKMKKEAANALEQENIYKTLPLVNESEEMDSAPKPQARRRNGTVNAVFRHDDILTLYSPTVEKNAVHHIVIDFSCIPFIDMVGSKIIKLIVEEYESVKVQVLLAGVKDDIWNLLKVTEFIPQHENRFYITVDDAVHAAEMAHMLDNKTFAKRYPQRLMYRSNNNPDASEGDTLLTSEDL